MTEVSPAADPAVQAPPAVASPVTPAAPAQGADPTRVEDLPQWAQKLITDTRSEAARYRTEKNSVAEQAKADAETAVAQQVQELSDKNTVLTADLDKANATVLKLTAAVEAEVPVAQLLDFASLLQGTTAEEIKASAEKAKRLLGPVKAPAVDPSQGAVGGANPEATPGLGRLEYAYSSKSSTKS